MRSSRLTGYLALAATFAATSTARAQDAAEDADEEESKGDESKSESKGKEVAQAAPASDLPEDKLKAMIAAEMGKARVGDVHMHGYFRAGYGFSSEKGRQVCFQAPGAKAKYRLGNECDLYGEWLFSAPAYVGDNGVVARANIMFNFYIPTTTLGYQETLVSQNGRLGKDLHFGYNQFYFNFEKIPFLGEGAGAWIGRRFYKREDIHITDYFWWNASGPGGGIEDIPISGPIKLSYAAFILEGNTVGDAPAPAYPPRFEQGLRNDLRVYGIPLHPGGQLVLGLNAIFDLSDTDLNNDATNNGFSGTAMYVLDGIMGGNNKVGAQYGVGAAVNANGVVGSLNTSTDTSFIQVIDNFFIQPTPEIGLQANLIYNHEDVDGGVKTDWISAGGRISYAFNDNAQLLAELGYDTEKVENQDRRNLTKITIAPVISAGKGYWARPQLRLFATFGLWNAAARAAGVDSGGVYTMTTKTSGATFGMQSESWW